MCVVAYQYMKAENLKCLHIIHCHDKDWYMTSHFRKSPSICHGIAEVAINLMKLSRYAEPLTFILSANVYLWYLLEINAILNRFPIILSSQCWIGLNDFSLPHFWLHECHSFACQPLSHSFICSTAPKHAKRRAGQVIGGYLPIFLVSQLCSR